MLYIEVIISSLRQVFRGNKEGFANIVFIANSMILFIEKFLLKPMSYKLLTKPN